MADRPARPAAHRTARLSIPNATSALRPMSAWLVGEARARGATARVAEGLELAANELVANIVTHAWPQGGTHEIALSLDAQDDVLRLEIVDDGVPFDPLSVPEPPRPATLFEAPIGGLGLPLARRSVDDCAWRRDGDRNVLTLRVRLDRGDASPASDPPADDPGR